ncbi:MAG: helix-turn-helix domain-containing protein [Deltaproteobacteria bacterium]|nr:helix-turn-helix domain-containing protein [Deltaproteobacteria bacterium]
MSDLWLGRYASADVIARSGAFHRHAARRAGDGSSCVVISASTHAAEAAARQALSRFARAHASVESRQVARSVRAEAEVFDGAAFVELDSRGVIDGASALDRLVDARARIGFAELGALLLAILRALRAAEQAEGGPYRLGRLSLSSLLVSAAGELELVGLGHPVTTTDEDGRVCTTEAVFQTAEIAAGGRATARTDRLAVAALRRALLPHVDLPPSLASAMRGEGTTSELASIIRALEADAPLADDELGAALASIEAIHAHVGIEPDPEGLQRLLSDLALGLPIQSDWDLRSGDLTEETTVVSASGAWIESPSQDRARVDLGPSLRRMLALLLTNHRTEPGRTSSTWDLLEAGWPDEKVLPDAGANRVYAAIKRLRNMGLRGVIERRDDGYRIAIHAKLTELDA